MQGNGSGPALAIIDAIEKNKGLNAGNLSPSAIPFREDMADDAAAVIRALGLRKVDVVGFSLVGYQAQDLTRRHPDPVRRLMLLGTGPRGGKPDSHPGALDTFILNGVNDVMIPTINSWHMAQNTPNAQLFVYPDAGHGAQFQYPDRLLKHAIQFLDE